MRYRKTEIWKSVDWITILLYLIMVIAGWFSICGASYEFDNVGLFDPSGRPGMQMIWIGTSLALIFVILMLESDFFDIFAYLIYACVIVLLIATIFLAPNIKGSHSWLVLGPIRLQPAELAKFATALAVAKFMNGYGFKLTTVKNFSITLFLIFLPMVCILLQKETGSALVYLAFFLMLYREGMTGYILLIGVCAVVFFVTGMKYSEVMVGITPLGDRFDILDRVCRFFVCPGKLRLDIDRLGRSRINLFILFIHSKLGMALCVNRSVRFRFYRFPVFCGLCV